MEKFEVVHLLRRAGYIRFLSRKYKGGPVMKSYIWCPIIELLRNVKALWLVPPVEVKY